MVLREKDPFRWRQLIGRFFRRLIVLFILVLILLGIYFINGKSPVVADLVEGSSAQDIEVEAARLFEESRSLEAQFRQLVQQSSGEAVNLEWILGAIEAQRKAIQYTKAVLPKENQRLEKLKAYYHQIASDPLWEESRSAGELAMRAYEDKQFPKAVKYFQLALQMQERINSEFELSEYRNVHRESKLLSLLREAEAAPMIERIDAMEARALEHESLGQWRLAYNAWLKTVELLSELNSVYRGKSVADAPRLRAATQTVKSYQGLDEVEQLEALMTQAKGANAATMEKLYREAMDQQMQINEMFPGSRFASRQRMQALRQTIDNERGSEDAKAILATMERVRFMLRNRQLDGLNELLSQCLPRARQYRRAYQHSSLIQNSVLEEIQLLKQVVTRLPTIWKWVDGNLRPVPAEAGLYMYRYEVPQVLYEAVMGTNPSVRKGLEMPVDSISFTEAQRFCEKMSYILGYKVQLPNANRFATLARKELLNMTEAVVEIAVVTSGEVSDGFYNIASMLNEWVVLKGNEPRLAVAEFSEVYGLAADRFIRLSEPGKRDAMIGFRFVVDRRERGGAGE